MAMSVKLCSETKAKFSPDYMDMKEPASNSYSKTPAAPRNVSTDSTYIIGDVQLDAEKDRKNVYDKPKDHMTGKDHVTGKEQTIGMDHVTGKEQTIGKDHVIGKEQIIGNYLVTSRDHVTGKEQMIGRDHVTGRGPMMIEKDVNVMTGSESIYEEVVEVSKKTDHRYDRLKNTGETSFFGMTCNPCVRLILLILLVAALLIILSSSVYVLATRGEDSSFQVNLIGEARSLNRYLDSQFELLKGIYDSLDLPENCNDLFLANKKFSKVYHVFPGNKKSINVFCDMTTSGGPWLVFQRRKDNSTTFERTWKEYAEGFGDPNGDFWLGNENLYLLTSNGNYKLRVDLEDWDGNKAYAEYTTFSIKGSDDFYRLSVSGYNGTAGDSLFPKHDGQQFTTKDADHDSTDIENCAITYKGGWWYNGCHDSNLNGLYLRGNTTSYAKGVVWRHWRGYHYSLKTTEMKISRVD